MNARIEIYQSEIDEAAEPSWRKTFMPRYEGAAMTWVRQKSWSGLGATLKEVRCTGPFRSNYQSDCSRFIVMLDAIGGRSNLRTNPSKPTPVLVDSIHQMSVIPANLPVYAHSDELRYMRHITFSFQAEVIRSSLSEGIDIRSLEIPRLMFYDLALLQLARVFELECESEDPPDLLYGDSLSLALLTRLSLLEKPVRVESHPRRLTSQQMRRVTEFMTTRLAESIGLAELAAIANLSLAHFSRAFRNSTGMPPYQWLLQQRINKAKELLLAGHIPIAQIALAAGFADQPHLTRVFTRTVGTPPVSWLRDRSH